MFFGLQNNGEKGGGIRRPRGGLRVLRSLLELGEVVGRLQGWGEVEAAGERSVATVWRQ